MSRQVNRSFGSGEVPDPIEPKMSNKTRVVNLFKLIGYSGEVVGCLARDFLMQKKANFTTSPESKLAEAKAVLAFHIVVGADSEKIDKDKALIESQRQSVLQDEITVLKSIQISETNDLMHLMIQKQIARLEQEIVVSELDKNFYEATGDAKQACQKKCDEERKKLEAMPTGDPIRHPKKLANKWLQAAKNENKPEITCEILDVLIKCGIGNKKEHEDKIAKAVLKLERQLTENPSPQRKIVILESLINRLQNDPSSSNYVSVLQQQLVEVKANLPH